eukprot:Awhi_evm1s10841
MSALLSQNSNNGLSHLKIDDLKYHHSHSPSLMPLINTNNLLFQNTLAKTKNSIHNGSEYNANARHRERNHDVEEIEGQQNSRNESGILKKSKLKKALSYSPSRSSSELNLTSSSNPNFSTLDFENFKPFNLNNCSTFIIEENSSSSSPSGSSLFRSNSLDSMSSSNSETRQQSHQESRSHNIIHNENNKVMHRSKRQIIKNAFLRRKSQDTAMNKDNSMSTIDFFSKANTTFANKRRKSQEMINTHKLKDNSNLSSNLKSSSDFFNFANNNYNNNNKTNTSAGTSIHNGRKHSCCCQGKTKTILKEDLCVGCLLSLEPEHAVIENTRSNAKNFRRSVSNQTGETNQIKNESNVSNQNFEAAINTGTLLASKEENETTTATKTTTGRRKRAQSLSILSRKPNYNSLNKLGKTKSKGNNSENSNEQSDSLPNLSSNPFRTLRDKRRASTYTAPITPTTPTYVPLYPPNFNFPPGVNHHDIDELFAFKTSSSKE